jgi:hypothetical protein
MRPILHTLLMGESGAGKDTFAATYPGPMLVWHLDGHGQDAPYMDNKILEQRLGNGKSKAISGIQEYQLGDAVIPYRDITMADDKFVRIEYFSSENPTYANAATVLEARMSFFSQEQDQWGALVCGSLSSVSTESRLNEQFVKNPTYKDPRKWYGAATEYLERLIFMQKSLRCNTVFICHIARQADDVGGEMLFGPDLPGRLSYQAGRYFNECYRVFVMPDEQGVRHRYLQTDNDGRFQCKTHIKAPNPCYPGYDELWSGWGD